MQRHLFTVTVLILALFAVGTVMAQETTPEPAAPTLTGVTWQWEHFASGAEAFDVTEPNYTLTFGDEGALHIKADCNTVLGRYTAEDSTLTITLGPSTLVACPEESLGSDFTSYLRQAAVYSFTDDGKLLIELPADSGSLTFAAQPQVTGTVTYFVRMALPAGSVIRVQVQDVSRADAPSILLGEQVITTEGEQVPFAFAVSYAESAVIESNLYSVSARITAPDGTLLFTSDSLVPVITRDNPTSDIELVLVRVGS